MPLLSRIRGKYSDIPILQKPSTDEFSIPTNADNLSDEELENFLLLFGAWRGWIVNQLAEIETQFLIQEESLELDLGIAVAKLERDAKKKMLKESLKGLAIESNLNLRELWEEVLNSKAEKEFLRNKFDLFNGLFEMISRTISRRASERYRT